MKPMFFLAVVTVLLFSSLLSSFEIKNQSEICNGIENLSPTLVGQIIPNQIPFSNEILNIYIENNLTGSLKIEDHMVVEISCNLNENATYNVKMGNVSKFQNIDENMSVLDLVNEKLSNGEIQIEGLSFGKNLKLFFLKIGLKIIGWFF
ncbi:hypothetical protein COT60_02990 [Candidatus Pacearchaeota archaeon CG09_land_8_20_14_0_10_30_9]|nr:MAG: hypothetical protein COT60_02990 [Candidatus Pacearchaeota archaeon CG09_land_8_20_14_0_10_30_9]